MPDLVSFFPALRPRLGRLGFLAATGFGAMALGAGFPAQARVGDAAWAQCVWRTAPVSAGNWLGMETPRWADNLATPAERLGHRLIAVCNGEAADERRPNRNPSWDALKSALRRARPRDAGTSETGAPNVLLCSHRARASGRNSVYRIDIVREAAGARTIVFQQYFQGQEDRLLRLPQDLRIIPAPETELTVACEAIASTGGLADAEVGTDGVEIAERKGAATRAFTILAALIAGAFAAQGASAQIASGFSGSSSTTDMGAEEAWQTLRAFGTCYASRYLPDALALIATEPASRAEAETYRRLFRRDNQYCLGDGTELRMSVTMVRGAIAEGLYRNGAALPPALAQSVPASGVPIRTLSEAARCYVATHRDRARALVGETAPASRQELAALDRMAPDFFRCVPATARGRQFNATQIRYRLAEALLRTPPPPYASAGQR